MRYMICCDCGLSLFSEEEIDRTDNGYNEHYDRIHKHRFDDVGQEQCREGWQVWQEIGRPGTVYMNVYEVRQNYGGPEEGGWYYDSGEPVASVPVPCMWELDEQNEPKPVATAHLAEEVRALLTRQFDLDGKRTGFQLRRELTFAMPFPRTRQFYH